MGIRWEGQAMIQYGPRYAVYLAAVGALLLGWHVGLVTDVIAIS